MMAPSPWPTLSVLRARSWEQVEQTLERAASQMRDGAVTGFERIVTGMTAELAYIVEIERGRRPSSGAATTSPHTRCG